MVGTLESCGAPHSVATLYFMYSREKSRDERYTNNEEQPGFSTRDAKP